MLCAWGFVNWFSRSRKYERGIVWEMAATALLQRAADTSQVDDHRLVGVLYLLGYSMEAMERRTEAMRYYQRVFAVDIEFRDVAQRVAAMEHQPT